eukprot:COSAG02_NODE_142_length_34188_cov_183.180791_16_plen_184_part_00
MPREPQTPRNPNLKKKNCHCPIESPHAAPAASPPRYPLQGKKNCRCLPSHSAYTNTILLYSTRSVSTHGVGNCLVEINLPTLPLSCSRLESRRVNRSRSMVIRSSLPAYLSNILFDLSNSHTHTALRLIAETATNGFSRSYAAFLGSFDEISITKGRLSWVGHSFALRMLPTVTSQNHSLCQS